MNRQSLLTTGGFELSRIELLQLRVELLHVFD